MKCQIKEFSILLSKITEIKGRMLLTDGRRSINSDNCIASQENSRGLEAALDVQYLMGVA